MHVQVARIRLENETFEGKNDAYLLQAPGEPTTLVDTGLVFDDVRDQLERGLAAHDVDFADVEEVLLTHWHDDHSGLAGEVQAAGGATVRVHEADAPVVADDPTVEGEMQARYREQFTEWGMPAERRAELLPFLADFGGRGDPPAVESFADGERLPCGLRAVHLPGHTAGLCGFVLEEDGRRELFSGDAVLPKYTPNVGGADVRLDRPLAAYLATLDRVVEGDYDRAWPGHRDPIDDPTARATAIRDHHRERAARVVETLADSGPADAWTVSAHLFGELEGIHVLHGPGEAFAHLDHLEAAGLLELERDGRAYALAVDAADALAGLDAAFD